MFSSVLLAICKSLGCFNPSFSQSARASDDFIPSFRNLQEARKLSFLCLAICKILGSFHSSFSQSTRASGVFIPPPRNQRGLRTVSSVIYAQAEGDLLCHSIAGSYSVAYLLIQLSSLRIGFWKKRRRAPSYINKPS